MVETADALPQKRLFIHLITRDITLEDAILDLIDNSINAVLLSNNVNLRAIFDETISGKFNFSPFESYLIDIQISPDRFEMTDNCGGILYEAAKHEVFQFGRSNSTEHNDTLSVYGIGLKRALFKLGNDISVMSHRDVPFNVSFSARDWEHEEGWTLPLTKIPVSQLREGESRIEVKELTAEVAERLSSPDFYDSLNRRITETYCFFVDRFCAIHVNGMKVEGQTIEVGSESSMVPAVQKIDEDGVLTIVMAGLAPKRDERWVSDTAGWYIFCNGRAVLFADKGRLTGWGNGLPTFVSKFRAFRGIVFYFSANPELLPWTTTKTDINEESIIYQRTLNLMYNTARPVLNFLNSLYSAEEVESAPAKAAAEAVRSLPIERVTTLEASTFAPPARRAPTTVNIQFSAKVADIDRARRHLRNPSLSARRVAELAFNYYLENEVG